MSFVSHTTSLLHAPARILLSERPLVAHSTLAFPNPTKRCRLGDVFQVPFRTDPPQQLQEHGFGKYRPLTSTERKWYAFYYVRSLP